MNRVEEQITQIHNNLEDLDNALGGLSVATSFACVPEKPCECEVHTEQPGQLGTSQLVALLQGINDRIFASIQRVSDINERIEL